ncbi:MAG TPA: DUF4198 domain-containing protein, partial [Thermoanaerobaculia bacterium]|nr:DUF4198 domain-containing protein [Thermoanaerobaculia bacterium]
GSGAVRTRVGLAFAVALATFAAPASATETWLHPVLPQSVVKAAPPARRGARPARPAVSATPLPFPTSLSGESSFVELTTGGRYPEPGSAIAPERIDRSFVRLGGGRPMPLTSAKADGAMTRLEATWAGQGLATLAVLLAPEARTLEAAEFEAFLRETGATAALAERTKKKETKKAAKIVSVESARAFAGVLAPPRSAAPIDPAAGTDEPLGLPLEIVAGVPPLPLRAGTTLLASVLLDGKPVPGAVVRAHAPGSDAPAVVAADAQGGVSLPLESEGRLLLATSAVRRTVKADRTRGEAWKKAEWEVQRTTLELLVLPRAPAPTPAPTKVPKGKGAAPKSKPR